MQTGDYEKKILSVGTAKFKPYNDKTLPRPNHSVFGDFPASHMPAKKTNVPQPTPLMAAEQSVAAAKNAMSK